MRIVLFCLLLLLDISSCRLVFDKLSSRVVTTNYGKLRGLSVQFEDSGLQDVEAYLGIQYASLKGSNLRFMPPTNPVEKWDGVKIANSFK